LGAAAEGGEQEHGGESQQEGGEDRGGMKLDRSSK
jgi:hypothetical protein